MSKTSKIKRIIPPADGGGGGGGEGGVFLENFTVLGVEQGVYSDGDTIPSGTFAVDAIKNMLTKVIPPTYTSPTLSINSTGTLNVEAGTVIEPTVTPTFNQNDGGAANDYDLTRNSVSIFNAASPTPYTDSFGTIGDQDVAYRASVSYDQGPVKNNNAGVPDPTGQIPAGTVQSNIRTYRGQRNLFYAADTQTTAAQTSATVRALANSQLNPSNGTTFTIDIAAGSTRVTFAYPATLRDVSSVKYVQLGNGEVKETFDLETVQVEGANGFTAINYKVYTYMPAIPYGSAATYTVTI